MPTIFSGGIEVSDLDVMILKNDLLDVEQWARDAVMGKIANCKKRMDAIWRPVLDADPEVKSIPASLEDRIALIVARSDYKDRAQRDEEEGIVGP